MDPRLCIAGAAALLAACAPQPPATVPASTIAGASGACNAQAAQFAVSQVAGDALAEEARAKAGARRVRVVRPGQMITKGFDQGRLTLEVDEFDRVRRVVCG